MFPLWFPDLNQACKVLLMKHSRMFGLLPVQGNAALSLYHKNSNDRKSNKKVNNVTTCAFHTPTVGLLGTAVQRNMGPMCDQQLMK